MDFLQSVLALIVTLGILITIHEFGHFWVARRCGVKVLRFSIGFGKPLFSWHDRKGTEYVIAALPLGGYVKMLDDSEGEVAPELAGQAFHHKSLSQRFAIVAAGPIANFILAIFTYWLIFIIGTQVPAPLIGKVNQGSVAEQAGLQVGDEILSINGAATNSWQDVGINLLAHMGETTKLNVEVQPTNSSQTKSLELPLNNFLAGQESPDPFSSLGLGAWQPKLEAVLGSIQPNSAAERAGLEVGDKILAINNLPVADWHELVQVLQASPKQQLSVLVERQQRELNLTLTPAVRIAETGTEIGFIGAGTVMPSWPEELLREERFGPFDALIKAHQKTAQMTWLTLSSLGKMVTGLISPSNLSGPITIARVASESAKSGWESYLSFLAYVSISLGILNLLPIPVLDGGHLFFYTLEAIRRKPVSVQVQEAATRIGLALLGGLMLMAFYFDLMRL